MSWQDFINQQNASQWAYQQQNASDWYSYFARAALDEGDKKLLEQIIADTVEYFESIKVRVGRKVDRQKLTKEQKERVIEFMKNRMKHYLTEGFLL